MRSVLACFCVLWLALAAACAAAEPTSSASEEDPVAKAAVEATLIVQRAQATALMLQAQAMATAMVERASTAAIPPSPSSTSLVAAQVSSAVRETPVTPSTPAVSTPEATDENPVEVVAVGFAAEGGFIEVKFHAPPEVAERWWQGSIAVIDEGTGTTYNEVPVMPRIGPLIGRPKREGQLGYAMLVNVPPGLRPGALVTVVLGDYRFEHVSVRSP
jgi:hypothetical protein